MFLVPVRLSFCILNNRDGRRSQRVERFLEWKSWTELELLNTLMAEVFRINNKTHNLLGKAGI